MIYHLLITILVGIAVAGGVMLARQLSGHRVAMYLVPLAAGLAMLTYNVWHEYTWFDRTVARLPKSIEVLKSDASASLFRPWTYVVPNTSRVLLLDTSRTLRSVATPDLVIVDFVEAERLKPTQKRRLFYDCASKRASDILPNAIFNADGLPAEVAWHPLDPGPRALRLICNMPNSAAPAR